MSSDVTAVVLSIGEHTTKRAIDSLRRQTCRPAEIIKVENVVPFSRALNHGASQVKTPFFVQVDSDMILDKNCLEDLRRCMTEDVGVAVGTLRDPLMGRQAGVKIFRTWCFDTFRFNDSMSPDTEFCHQIGQAGWSVKYVLNQQHRDPQLWPAFGDHRPDYTPLYTYWRFRLLGTRYRYRPDLAAFKWRYEQLGKSRHRFATLARICFLHGLFFDAKNDMLRPFMPNACSKSLFEFMEGTGVDQSDHDIESFLAAEPKQVFEAFFRLGVALKRRECYRGFQRCLSALNGCDGHSVWLARAALCHGIFPRDRDGTDAGREFEALRSFFLS